MEILDFALTDAYLPFTTSFALMCGIGAVEAIGLGIGSLDLDMDGSPDIHADAHSSLLDWLGLGHEMPILIWLTSLLACFTVSGFGIQQTAEAIANGAFEWPIAVGIATPTALVLNFFAANGLHRVMPRTETTAISTDDLLGRRGILIGCDAAVGAPSRAKIVDQHGQAHYVAVVPHADAAIPVGCEVLLVRREKDLFYAITDDAPVLSSMG
jgi:hypothetical protein